MRASTRLIGLGALCAWAVAATADDPAKAKPPLTDQQFVIMAASSDLAEIKMSTAAQDKASEKLKEAAKAANPGIPEQMLADHKKHADMVVNHAGADFDKAYMQHQVMHHKEAVELFTRATKELKNDKLKAFAEATLPVIKEHDAMAKKISDRLGTK